MAARQSIDFLECVGQAQAYGSLWALSTTQKLVTVLDASYWERHVEKGLRVHDRVSVTADLNGTAQYATLVITGIKDRRVVGLVPLRDSNL
jgi:hypothetical protein